MRYLGSILRLGALLLLGVFGLLLAQMASADIKAHCNRNNSHIKLWWRFPCSGEHGKEEARSHGNPPEDVCLFHIAEDSQDPDNFVIGFGCCLQDEEDEETEAFVITSGCSEAGRAGLESFQDHPWASIGFVPDPIPADASAIPTDAKMRMQVQRTVTPGDTPDIITMTFLGGGMQTRILEEGQTADATLKVIIYPDQAAADADSSLSSGAGSLFYGEATLVGTLGSVAAVSGFSTEDFILEDNGGGQFTARVLPGLVKTAFVPDAEAAIVSMVGDPKAYPANVTGVPGAKAPTGLWLRQAAPNPARGADMRIRFAIPRAGRVTLDVYDQQGRYVRGLMDGTLTAGEHDAHWDGRDASGQQVPSGQYFYRLETVGGRLTGKVVTIR
jgi:hypothetical protein